MSKRQDHILISYYEAKYAQKYGRRPLVNRHREKWGFQDMLESLPMEDCKRVIDYYLDLDVSHTVRGLLHKFDVYFENMNESEAEKAERIGNAAALLADDQVGWAAYRFGEDAVEGLAAFKEKRKPVWTGN